MGSSAPYRRFRTLLIANRKAGTVSIPGVYDNSGRRSKRSHGDQDNQHKTPQQAKGIVAERFHLEMSDAFNRAVLDFLARHSK